MLYRIADLSVDARSGHTRVLVHFWPSKADFDAGRPAVVVNDFYNNYRGGRQIPVSDGRGHVRVNGEWVPPWVEDGRRWVHRTDADMEPQPIPAMVHDDIVRWWNGVGKAKAGDHRDPGFRKAPQGVDPLASLARPDVQALKARVWSDEEAT